MERSIVLSFFATLCFSTSKKEAHLKHIYQCHKIKIKPTDNPPQFWSSTSCQNDTVALTRTTEV